MGRENSTLHQRRRVQLLILFLAGHVSAHAEVVLDGSLGQSGALAGPVYAITQDMGQTLGSNLFHSFSDFNLTNNEAATFSGSTNIEHIISRVTGTNPSNIDGTIRSTISGADLYFINPNGVMFGENASLEVSGSFYASTADYLTLGTDGRFDVSQAGNSVLSSAAPSAFGFLSSNIAPIEVNGARLSVTNGNELALVGGDIALTGNGVTPLLTPTLGAPAGRVLLASVKSEGEVDFVGSVPSLMSFTELGTIDMNGQASIKTGGIRNGTIIIRGGELRLSEDALLTSNNQGLFPGQETAIDIDARNNIHMSDSLVVSDAWLNGGAGDVNITTSNLTMIDSSQIVANITGNSMGGDINVSADTISLDGTLTGIGMTSLANGSGGNITIDANQISLDNGAGISAVAFGNGSVGDIEINTSSLLGSNGSLISSSNILGNGMGELGRISINADSIVFQGSMDIAFQNLNYLPSGILMLTEEGSSKDIYVTANSLQMNDLAGIHNMSLGSANSGNIIILSGDTEIRNGSAINTVSFGTGGSGDISINGNSLLIDGANSKTITLHPDIPALPALSLIISAARNDAAYGGDIDINVNTIGVRSGAGIGSQTFGSADAGNITINTDSLLLTGMAESARNAYVAAGLDPFGVTARSVITSTSNVNNISGNTTGTAGNITINAGAIVLQDGAAILNSANSAGNAGNISINANTTSLHNEARILSTSLGTGNAGSININNQNSLVLLNSSILTQADYADGGDIQIAAQDLIHLYNSAISASVAGGAGNGGNVDIDPRFFVLNKSNITARANAGSGGNITLVASNFIVSADSAVSASSNLGVDGNVVIDAPDRNVDDDLETLKEPPADVTRLFRNDCVAVGSGFSRFTLGRSDNTMNRGGRRFIPSRYVDKKDPSVTVVSQVTRQTEKPLLVLAESGVDCLGKNL